MMMMMTTVIIVIISRSRIQGEGLLFILGEKGNLVAFTIML